MHSCFNCIFPVEGAPAAFPRPKQTLPLVVRLSDLWPFNSPNNFTCIFGEEHYVNRKFGVGSNILDGDFACYFNSGPGHVDGPGSMISFDFYGKGNSQPLTKMQFVVFASITNSNPAGIPNWTYLIGAKSTWGTFIQKYLKSYMNTNEIRAIMGSWMWNN